MKQIYRQSEQFHLQHRGKTLFFEWLFKARDRRRLMSIVNERFHRQQRNTLKSERRNLHGIAIEPLSLFLDILFVYGERLSTKRKAIVNGTATLSIITIVI